MFLASTVFLHFMMPKCLSSLALYRHFEFDICDLFFFLNFRNGLPLFGQGFLPLNFSFHPFLDLLFAITFMSIFCLSLPYIYFFLTSFFFSSLFLVERVMHFFQIYSSSLLFHSSGVFHLFFLKIYFRCYIFHVCGSSIIS